eukprot:m.224765 g.224765  ORF g.224765 m.224765 type:complete len:480 (+) comp18776_c0_seq1:147-1586(+)
MADPVEDRPVPVQQGKKKKKKTKGKTLSLHEFVGETAVVAKPGLQAALPSAPRSSGGAIDLSTLPTSPPFTAFVGNLAYEIDEEDVARFFREKECGVVSVRIPRDGADRIKGFGYTEFETQNDLANALALSGEPLLGRPVRVDLASQNDRDGDRAGGDRGGREGDDPDFGRSDFGDWRGGPKISDRAPPARGSGGFGDRGGDRFGNRDRDGGDRYGGASDDRWDSVRSQGPAARDDRDNRPRHDDRGPRSEPSRSDDAGDWRSAPREERPPRGGDDFDRFAPRRDDRGPRRDDRGHDEFDRFAPRDDRRDDRGPRRDDRGHDDFDRFAERAPREERGRDDRYAPRPDEPSDWRKKPEEDRPAEPERQPEPEAPRERPKLKLAPRSEAAASEESAAGSSKASPFGAARPVDTAAKLSEVEEKLKEVPPSAERRSPPRKSAPAGAPPAVVQPNAKQHREPEVVVANKFAGLVVEGDDDDED